MFKKSAKTMTHNHNSPQPTEQSEVLYRWVKASERLPEESIKPNPMVKWEQNFGKVIDGKCSYLLFTTLKYYSEHPNEYFNVEWLEPLPSQPGESVDALANAVMEEIENESEEQYPKSPGLQKAFRSGATFGYNLSRPSPSVDAEPSPQEAVQDVGPFLVWLLNQRYDLIVDTDIWERPGGFQNTTAELYRLFKSNK